MRPLGFAFFLPIAVSAGGPQPAAINAGALKLFRPLPQSAESAAQPGAEAKVKLGRLLFHEPRISRNRDISCNTCHPLARFGADGAPVSTGHNGKKGVRNAPTVFNSAGHLAQFWDGRARDVEEQARGPILNPIEMAMSSESEVAGVLRSIPEYLELFRTAFPEEKDPVTFVNLAKAIGAFERRLLTPSRWDRFLRGDRSALDAAEIAGFNRFVAAGCAACHLGPYVGGGAYQKLGMIEPWTHGSDLGRFEVTRKEADKRSFKVPSLRNVMETAPYFHDGSIPTIEEAVRTMARFQTGKRLSPDDIRSIVAWLRTLTGEPPAAYLSPPELPGR